MKSCPHCGASYSDNVTTCPLDHHPLDGPAETRIQFSDLPESKMPNTCPKCGVTNDFTYTVEPRSSFSLTAYLLGGIFAVLLRNSGRPRRVICNHCETRFYVRHRLSIFARVLFWLLVGPVVIGLLVILIALLTNLFSH